MAGKDRADAGQTMGTAGPAAAPHEIVDDRDDTPLATAWGQRRTSRADTTSFSRASGAPDAVLVLRYDHRERLQGHPALVGGAHVQAMTPAGAVSVALVDDGMRMIPAVDVGGEVYAVGLVDQRYAIGVENDASVAMEAVVAVDGVDVVTGETASTAHRGYVIAPYSSAMIEGFRVSAAEVAEFRFAPPQDGYASRTGRPGNVGVIGVAFFASAAASPYDRDAARRHRADPFPGDPDPFPDAGGRGPR